MFGQLASGLPPGSCAQHAPKLIEDINVDEAESFRCHHMTVVVGPALKRFAKLLDEARHRRADVFANTRSHLLHEDVNSLNRRRDVQDLAMLAKGLPGERKSVFFA